MDTLREWLQSLRRGAWIYVVLLSVLGIIGIAASNFIEDFATSFAGYKLWPTAKINTPLIYYTVALLPQLGQIAFAWLWLFKDHQMAKWYTLGLFIWDTSTDVYFKSNGLESGLIIYAAIESVLLFTLGSEILLALSLEALSTVLGVLRGAGASRMPMGNFRAPGTPRSNNNPPRQGTYQVPVRGGTEQKEVGGPWER